MEKMQTRKTGNTAGPDTRKTGSFRTNLVKDDGGAVLVEAAFALPILIMLLLGMVSYGLWFMAAHSLQQAANEAARAAIAGLDETERTRLVNESIENGVLQSGTLNAELVSVETDRSDNFYTVTLQYDAKKSKIFQTSIVPLPDDTIQRAAVVQLQSL